MRSRIRSTLALALALAAAPLAAATVAGVAIADSAKAGDETLALNGAALRTKFLFKVYVGALYLARPAHDAAAILAADAPRRMEMHFVRSVSAARICGGWKDGLAANVAQPSPDVRAGFDRLCALTKDVSDGSVLAFTYVPGSGTTIEVDGKSQGSIAGKDFADALLACWIGPKPDPGEDFKRAVLGG